MGHTINQCWSANPNFRPPSIKAPNPTSKHMAAFRVTFDLGRANRRGGGSQGDDQHFSLDYAYMGGTTGFHGMALGYRRGPNVVTAAKFRGAMVALAALARKGRGRPAVKRAPTPPTNPTAALAVAVAIATPATRSTIIEEEEYTA